MKYALWVILFSVGSLYPATLSWDALDPNSGVIGYDVHYGPDPISPTIHLALGNVLTTQLNAAGTNYYFVTGRDAKGTNSLPSDQVVWPIPVPTPTPQPTPTPTPSPAPPTAHTHNIEDVIGLQESLDHLREQTNTYRPHTHPIPAGTTGE
jgi:hypothetical protein